MQEKKKSTGEMHNLVNLCGDLYETAADAWNLDISLTNYPIMGGEKRYTRISRGLVFN